MQTNKLANGKQSGPFGSSDGGRVANAMLGEMLDGIGNLHVDPSMTGIVQVMVYSRCDPHSARSIPTWNWIGKELSERLQGYRYMTVEIGDSIRVGGKKSSGAILYKSFEAKNVPFFVQDFKVVDQEVGGRMVKVITRSMWWDAFEGEMQPFSFLAAAFGVANPLAGSDLVQGKP